MDLKKLLWMACEVLHNMLKEIARLEGKSADRKGWMVQENIVQQIRKAFWHTPNFRYVKADWEATQLKVIYAS